MRNWTAVTFIPLIAVASLAAAGAVAAEPAKADAAAGKVFAQEKCASCHALETGAKVSSNVKAPPFALVATSKLVTSREIDIWLQTAHPDMPDLSVPANKRADVIAFIASLAAKK